jgi:electron transfer flavoprotein beta subunit
MKILVCIKQVPQKDAPLRLNPEGTWIRDDVSWETNEPDAYALEEALRQKEKHGGEVAVITAGPARSQQVLREALAKGADRAIHLEDDRFAQMDAANTARALGAAIGLETPGENFDLIVTGLQSDDFGAAQTGVLLAIIIGIEKTDTGLKLKRELEAGHYQHIEMTMPAVLTIQSGINKLRYATLIGIKQAKTKPMRKVAWAEVEGKLSKSVQKIEKLYVPGSKKKTRKIEAPAGEAAKQVVEYLKNEARVM